MENEKLIARLRKILALAERGVDGEKTAAEAHLASLLKKHGMTLEDLVGAEEPPKWREVHYGDDTGRRLMEQVVMKVTGDRGLKYRQRKGARSKAFFLLTKSQLVEVEFLFAIMREALTKEIKLLTTAFIHKNQLYAPVDPDEPPSERILTLEQLAEIKRMRAIMSNMEAVEVHKAIAH